MNCEVVFTDTFIEDVVFSKGHTQMAGYPESPR